jgi:hypothetical protein
MNDDARLPTYLHRCSLLPARIYTGVASSKMRTKTIYLLCALLLAGASFHVKADDEPDIDDSVATEVRQRSARGV